MSEPKHIVLGVSGSIAAHKAIDLASLLTKAGHSVDVVLTRDAQEFVKPLPFRTLTRRPVITSLYDEDETGVTHIRSADTANLMVVAPATANTIAKLAHGIADDALGCVALALNPNAPMLIAPAMNGKMWHHPATQANVELWLGRPWQGCASLAEDQPNRITLFVVAKRFQAHKAIKGACDIAATCSI